MKYSLDQMHTPKNPSKRGNGKTVDALVDVIGKLMVTDHQYIVLVLSYHSDAYYVQKEFTSLCIEHFDETPTFKSQFQWGIQGYSSTIEVMSDFEYHVERLRGKSLIEFTYDLRPNKHL